MPATLAFGFHESNRGEYLAQYFLSALGVSAPVIRQEDIGVDFFCSLAREENKKLTFHSPYMVQQGAADAKEFIYGGYTDKGKWRGEGVEWLFSQELPLFACITDREKARFRLYSTSAMWLVCYQFGTMTQIELCPDEHHDPLKESRGDRIGKEGHGDGFEYRVPLGNPVVDLDIFQLTKDNRQQAIQALTIAINVEQTNLTFRRLGVYVASWFNEVKPNDPASLAVRGGSVFWNGECGKNVPPQIDSLKNIAVTLAVNLHEQGDADKLAHLAPVFRLFDKHAIPPWIMEKLPRIVMDNIA